MKKIINNIYNLIKKYIVHLFLILIGLFLAYFSFIYYNRYLYILRDPVKIKGIIMSYGKFSILAFIILQVVQVVAFFIPGEFVQVAGGYIYGTAFGCLISFTGIIIGSSITYFIASKGGKPLIHKIIPKNHMKFFDKASNYGKINNIIFLLYLIPGMPKDVLGYMCGITDITFKDFFMYSSLGRIPGIMISSYFGAKLYTENRAILIFIGVVMSILFVFGVLKSDYIIKNLAKNNDLRKKNN